MSSDVRYPLASDTWGVEEYQAIRDVLDTGRFTMGSEVSEFEREFADYVGVRHAVMVNSGSSANLLGAAALTLRRENPWRRGDEIIVPAVSWSTSYFPFSQYGITLRFVDVESARLTIDPEAVRSAITPKTRGVLAVPLLGHVPYYAELLEIINEHSLELVEDCCEALGAYWGDKHVGGIGTFGTFSTFFSHHISTMEGGLIVTNDPDLYHIVLSLRAHGWTREQPGTSRLVRQVDGPVDGGDEFDQLYRFVLPGYNLRPLELQAAVGRVQLRRFSGFLDLRRRNARYFHGKLKECRRFETTAEHGGASYFALPIISGRDVDRRIVVDSLRRVGVELRPVVAGNFVQQPVIAQLDHTVAGPLDVASRVHERGLMIGNNPVDLTEQVDLVTSTLRDIEGR